MKNTETHIVKSHEICRGKWVLLKHIEYVNKHGHNKVWECAARVNSRGGAMIIAVMKPSERVIVVKQFRPPLNCKSLEFPAGLIDPGETPENTALRELYEETGYKGRVVKSLPPVCNSPGLSGELTYPILLEVDDDTYPVPPHPALEADEDIETMAIYKHELLDFLTEASQSGVYIDAKLMTYALCHAKGL
jgi:8-oxo-dGTP pyrophosphatase MutT (NUDIX family)